MGEKGKKLVIFIITFILVFQDSITEITGISYGNYIDEFFILILFFAALVKSQGRFTYDTVKMALITASYFCIGIFYCIVFSEYSIYNLIMSGILSIKFFLIVISAASLKISENTTVHIINSVKAMGVISAVAGTVNFIVPELWNDWIPYTWTEWKMGLPGIMGLFIHPGQFGWFMFFTAILYYAEYKTDLNRKKLYICVIYSALAIASLKVKVIVGVVCVILAEWYVIEKKSINIKKMIGTLTGAGAVAVIFGDYIYRSLSLYIFGTASEVSARYTLLDRSLKIFMDYFPFGVGFGKFGSWYAKINYSEYYYIYECTNVYGLQPSDPAFATDTFWPSVIAETGLLGISLYVYLLICIVKRLLRVIRNYADGMLQKWVALFGFLAFVQSLAESMGEAAFNSSPQNIFLGFVIGLGISMWYRM